MLTDVNYLVNGAAHTNQVVLGALVKFVLVVAAIGTAMGSCRSCDHMVNGLHLTISASASWRPW